MRILLAMSGGVDSSTAAHLLTAQGNKVVGVRFALWSDPQAPPLTQILPTKCCTTQNISRADAVAKQLNIPLHVIDLIDEFKSLVVDEYLEALCLGLTPNPCVGCNRRIKFDRLIKLADELDCEKVATGHYARVAIRSNPDGIDYYSLLEATDKTKDQSYFLHTLTQKHLSRVVFPLGTLKKSAVMDIARGLNIPLPKNYLQSQDLCFFPEKTPDQFLRRHLKDSLKPGDIVKRDGTVLGKHEGLPLYTLGQRRGLKVGGQKIPLEVVSKEVKTNRLVVASKGEETVSAVGLDDMRFVSWRPEEGKVTPFECRTRSLSEKKPGTLVLNNQTGIFHFEKPEGPLSPGQSLVLYRDEEVVGGGVMQPLGLINQVESAPRSSSGSTVPA